MFVEKLEAYKGKTFVYHPYPDITDRKAWDSLDEEWKDFAIRRGESLLGYEWPYLSATEYMDFCRTGNRQRYEQRYFMKRFVLNDLVLAECVENKKRFLDDIINGIISICEESSWTIPAHNYYEYVPTKPLPNPYRPILDLMSCECGSSLATAVYLLEEVLDEVTPAVTKRVRYELERRIYQPFLHDFFWWMGARGRKMSNWTTWCVQNILISSLLISGSEGMRREILTKAATYVDMWIDAYGEDGCCDEGAGYYPYAGLKLGVLWEIFNSVTKGGFETLLQDSKIKNIATYIYKVHIDDDYYLNYGDGGASSALSQNVVLTYHFAKLLGHEGMKVVTANAFRCGISREMELSSENSLFNKLLAAFLIKEIRAYSGEMSYTDRDMYFSSMEMMVVRDDKLVLSIRGGNNDDNHNHNDVGSFIIYKNGKPLFIDVGVETYTQKTFSAERYTIWTMQSSYHNLPEINGMMQLAGSRRAATDVVCDLEAATYEAELKNAYPAECGIRSYRRKAVLNKGKEIVIQDTFSWMEPDKENTLSLNLMTWKKPVVQSNDIDGMQCVLIGAEEWEEPGQLLLDNARVVAVEEIPVEDARLKRDWEDAVYRIKVEPVSGAEKIVMKIR